MKKSISIILSIVLCFSLCACSNNSGNTESVEDKIRTHVRTYLDLKVYMTYGVTSQSITCYISKDGENKYKVSGKITIRDKYGDPCSGKYDAIIWYDPETNDCDIRSCNIGDFYYD